MSDASTEPSSPDQSERSDIIPILVEGESDEEEGSQAQGLATFEVSRLRFVAHTTGILTTNLAR